MLKDPLVTTDLPLPKTDSSDVTVETTVENVSDQPVSGVARGTIENIVFSRAVTLAPHSTQQVTFDAKNTPALHIAHPRLWWPNGYGAQPMYKLHLEFVTGQSVSDAQDVSFGIRKISYFPSRRQHAGHSPLTACPFLSAAATGASMRR